MPYSAKTVRTFAGRVLMAQKQVAEPSLLQRAEANHDELFRAMARISPRGQIAEDPDLTLVMTGALLPMLNFARLRRPPVEPEEVLARARAFFDGAGMRFMIHTSGASS